MERAVVVVEPLSRRAVLGDAQYQLYLPKAVDRERKIELSIDSITLGNGKSEERIFRQQGDVDRVRHRRWH